MDILLNNNLTIDIVNKSNNELPEYATICSAGMDLRAFIPESVTLKSLERKMISTGLYIQLPIGYEAQVRPRSGMAIKYGITVINTPGTIDSDYIGEICVLLVNLSNEEYTIHSGDRIAQMVITSHNVAKWNSVDELKQTERGSGGFGHTGKK